MRAAEWYRPFGSDKSARDNTRQILDGHISCLLLIFKRNELSPEEVEYSLDTKDRKVADTEGIGLL
mgnify:CR=1 FL=1